MAGHHSGSLPQPGRPSVLLILQERPDVRFHTVAVDFLPPPVIGEGMSRIAAWLAKGAWMCANICGQVASV